MKSNYEDRAKSYLVKRTPVIIRIDGKACHTFTKHLKKPYDEIFHTAMDKTMEYLCRNIQGCKLGYTQSDEISLLLTDFDTLTTSAWFDFAVQKMSSVTSSMATLAFNKVFAEEVEKYAFPYFHKGKVANEDEMKYLDAIFNCKDNGLLFDARCFSIPKEEVCNYFIWRQIDATRNAIQMLAHTYFSHKELQCLNSNQLQDKLMIEKHINFNDMPTEFKRGICFSKNETGWAFDKEIPIFSKNRDYVEEKMKCADK